MEHYTQHIIVHGDGITLDLMVKPETDLMTPSRHGTAMQRNTSWSPDGWSMRSRTRHEADRAMPLSVRGLHNRPVEAQHLDGPRLAHRARWRRIISLARKNRLQCEWIDAQA
jgi:hypothetical protein